MEKGEIFTADSGRRYEVIQNKLSPHSSQESDLLKVMSLDEENKPLRALKKYKHERDKEILFEHELDVLRYLNNGYGEGTFPGVVKVHDSSRKDLFLVLEYVEGVDFRYVMDEIDYGNFSALETFALIREFSGILSGIFYQAGVVHRDVKPENILLHKSVINDSIINSIVKGRLNFNLENIVKSPENIKFCDFALSIKNGESKVHESTKKGFFRGSWKYCSPELLKGERGESPSDVWALGIMVYDMVSDEGAYPGVENIQDFISYTILNKSPPSLKRKLFGFEEFLYQMREEDPHRRPTIGEVYGAVSEFYNKHA